MALWKAGQIVNVMKEERVFPPPAEFAARARIGSPEEYEKLCREAADDLEGFWGRLAGELHWFRPFTRVLEWEEPVARWFVGGQTNVSYNCLDAHLGTARGDKPALVWEGEPGEVRTLTYRALHAEVCRVANVLKKLGIGRGDVVSMYMPLVPELAVAMLACARIGAVHCVIFAGFSAEAVAERNRDAAAKLIITADAGWRRGKLLPLKAQVDAALAKSPSVQKCLVLRRAGPPVAMLPGRDLWWHDALAGAADDCSAEPLPSETPLFILYTSGSTGKPKGIVHTTAGYNLYVKKTSQWVFDLRDDDVYLRTADLGWVTGHSYVVYGPLSAGATTFMYEGAPIRPRKTAGGRSSSGTRSASCTPPPRPFAASSAGATTGWTRHDLSSLRLLGSVGEGINPEAWMWYHQKVGGGRCPIVDTWWQTETGGIMISPLPGAIAAKPGSCTKPLPGVFPEIVGEDGEPVGPSGGGRLVIARPWPGMLRGIWGDAARYRLQYWNAVPHKYLCGDNARCDEEGYYWIMGRIDDVLNVSGHRLSTIEIEARW